ncbi:hypothetical protein D3C73_426980 [compost metagenome]
MDEEARVRQRDTAFLRRGCIDQRARGSHPASSDNPDLRLDELDHVMDGIARFDVAAGGVHIDANIFVAGCGERNELRVDLLRQFLGNRTVDEDRARLEKIRLCFLAERQFLGLVVVVVFVVQHSQCLLHGIHNIGHNVFAATKQWRVAASHD